MSLPIENGEDSEEVIFEERTEELFFPVEDEEVFEEELTELYQEAASREERLKRMRERDRPMRNEV
jgi:hypothetical protein